MEIITANLMVAIEGVCIAFMLVILSACLFSPHSSFKKNNWYLCTVIFTILGLVSDLLAWACEIGPSNHYIQYISDFLAVIMTNFIVSAYAYYAVDQINERHQVSKNVAHVIMAVNIIGVIVAAIGAFTGDLFDIDITSVPGIEIYNDGGILYEIPVLLSGASYLFMFGLVLYYGRNLSKRKIAVFTIYFLLPLIASALEMLTEEILLTYAAVSVSVTIMFVMLQSNSMNEVLVREQVLSEMSYVDQLTGLMNRRACDRDIALARRDDDVSVVFCDLNGLKRINDERGHKAGDAFLNTFAKIITRHFPHENVYRISGDEFVVMTRNMDKAAFEQSVANLRQEIDDNAGIAALGTITGNGDAIPQLIRSAEMSMYADKKLFYRSHPDYRRGRDAYMEEEN